MTSDKQTENPEDIYYFLEKQIVTVHDFDAPGFILDIGGGGEGIIGQLKGKQVIAIDPNRRELEEAADGPLKIIMDAREMLFLDNTFNVVTSFFTLMYIKVSDQKKVFKEVFRVLESDGRFLIWDVEIPQRIDIDKDVVAFYLKAILPDREVETGYGTKWPEKIKDLSHYKEMAKSTGFITAEQKANGRVFFLEFQKP
jgi:ubiquinone/menaquinone biosynthesis C-methylase UbiE